MMKPTISSSWQGVKGNMWREYVVTYKGKKFYHKSKTTAIMQYNSAMRIYKKSKM